MLSALLVLTYILFLALIMLMGSPSFTEDNTRIIEGLVKDMLKHNSSQSGYLLSFCLMLITGNSLITQPHY